jgi:outer membrane murein-binding lipoprotein Lpp
MRYHVRLAPVLIVGMIALLHPSRGDAQALSFYTGSGNNMFRVFGCPPLATLSLNGTGPSQQGDCTTYQTGTIIPAVPIEAWVAAQMGAASGLRAHNDQLQKQVDELTARVQALEAALQKPRSEAPAPPPSAAAR